MAVVELDPFFVKALKLLQSRSKESTDQLKQMLVEALATKKVKADMSSFALDEDDRWELARASSPARPQAVFKSESTSEHVKKRESEKRTHDKIKSEPSDHVFEAKKPKLEVARPSPSHTPEPRPEKSKDREKSKDSHKDKSKDSHREKSKDSHKERSKDSHSERSKDKDRSHRDKDRERAKEKDREKEKEREREREREKEREREREKEKMKTEIKWEVASNGSDNDDMQMDADTFAMDMGITCIVCKQMNQSSGNQLVECQECHNLYHQECHRPPVTEQDVNDPRFVWYCSRCTKNMKKMVTKPARPKVPPIIIPKEQVTMKPPRIETPTLLPFKRVLDPVKPSSAKELASSSSRGQGMGLTGLASLAANFSGKDSSKVKLTTPDTTKLKNPFESAKLTKSDSLKSASGPPTPLPIGLAALATAAASKSEKSGAKPKVPSMTADKRLQMMKKKAAEKQIAKRLK